MKVEELRLGNYVKYRWSIIKVLSIVTNGINVKAEFDYKFSVQSIKTRVKTNDITPIPLTEEWLVKFGFEESSKSGFDLMLRISAIRLYARKSTNWYFQLEDIYLGDSNLKYVHQLQNFVYSISGKELTI